MTQPSPGAASTAAPHAHSMPVRCVVVGATGYVGRELTLLLERHPGVALVGVMSARPGAVPPPPAHPGEPAILPYDEALLGAGDAVFLATPHGTSGPLALAALAGGARVIDLSADFRLRDAAQYQAVYGAPHAAPELLDAAVYALVEHARPALRGARLAACPGCYPTSVLLPSLPLVARGAVASGSALIANSASGVSGAGKQPNETTLYGNVEGNYRAYGVGKHRHQPEIQQELDRAASDGRAPTLVFVPHLLPTFRGILSTLYVEPARGWDADRMRAALAEAYAGEACVHVHAAGEQPGIADVARSNRCHIAVADGGARVVITSAIDNLVKGAAGQGVQAMNCMFGLPETLGLGAAPTSAPQGGHA
ncbi:MAG: N-acetyl-gamma-glutamyl-phosphate reductase [Planctomycetota bacterium]